MGSLVIVFFYWHMLVTEQAHYVHGLVAWTCV